MNTKPTYEELLATLIEVREAYMAEGCDGCGTIDEDTYKKVQDITQRVEIAQRLEG